MVRPPKEGDIEVHGGYVQRTAEVTDSRPHSWALRALSADMTAVDRVVQVLKRAFESGKREVEAADPSRQFDRLFEGSAEQIADRWKCSAVMLSDDRWAVVPFEGAARVEGSARCVRVAELGTMSGRVHLRDAAWFKANAVRIYLGALSLPEGGGANSTFPGGGLGDCAASETGRAPSPRLARDRARSEGERTFMDEWIQ